MDTGDIEGGEKFSERRLFDSRGPGLLVLILNLSLLTKPKLGIPFLLYPNQHRVVPCFSLYFLLL